MDLPLGTRIIEIAKAMQDVANNSPHLQCRLLCSSFLSGNAWQRELQRLGKPIPQVGDIWELVNELAEPTLAQQQLRAILPLEQEALVTELWNTIEPGLSVKSKAQIGSGIGFARTLQSTLHELRLAGIEANHLEADPIPAREKGRFLHDCLGRYEQALQEKRLADPATVIGLARDRLIEEEMLPGIHLLIPQELKFSGLLQSVLDQIPPDCVTILADPSVREPGAIIASDIGRLAWMKRPHDAPDPLVDGSVKLYRTLSPEYEVRAAIGVLLHENIPFDQAEILYSDEEVYPKLFYSLLAATQPNEVTSLPITFGGGRSIEWTRPGRAMLLWLHWIESEFLGDALNELIVQNLIPLPAGASQDVLARLLRQAPGCVGQEGWRRYLQDQQAKPEQTSDQRRDWLSLHQLLEGHFRSLPELIDETEKAWQAIEQFLTEQVRLLADHDRQAQQAGLAMVQALKHAGYSKVTEVWERMRHWAKEAHLPAEHERPGCLMLTPLNCQESVRRPHTLCVGLSEDSFPRMPQRDTILTDRERKSLSPELAQRSVRELMHQQEESLITLLAQLHGKVVFTYPCADQTDDRERFPSQLFLRIFRLTAQLPEGDLHELENWLQAPLGPGSTLCRITSTEAWLNQMPDKPFYDALFKKDFPLLCRGAYAEGQRRRYQFTEFDGAVPAAGAEFDLKRSNPVFSTHSLEQYARCPLQYFYQHVLGLAPPSSPESIPGRWLHPLQRGVILHSVFHRYHVHLQQEKRGPHRQQDITLLHQYLDEELQHHERILPAASQHIRQTELVELHETLNIFLGEETQWTERFAPRYFETTIGMKPTPPLSPLDSAQPMGVLLPSGRTISVRGRVDRIDEVIAETEKDATGTYFVWDYKTGRMTEYQDDSARRTGQLLQPLLYLEMIEKRLREVIGNNATVSGAGYFFPGQRGGQGDRLMWSAEQLRRCAQALDTILDLLQAGVFLPTEKEATCEYCAYRSACQVGEVNKQAGQKLKYNSSDSLKQLWQLRRSS